MERGTPTEWRSAEALLRAWATHIAACRGQTEQSVGLLSADFSELVGSLDAVRQVLAASPAEFGVPDLPPQAMSGLADQLAQIRDQIDGCLHHLQFQDRVDQVLLHVQDSISGLARAYGSCAEGGTSNIDFSGAMAALVASYTTLDEVALHSRKSIPDTGDEPTYF